MPGTRLSAALAQGGLEAQGATTLAVGIESAAALAPLAPAGMIAVQPWQPLHARLAAAGMDVRPEFPAPAEGPFELAYVVVPRARARAQVWLAEAAARLAPGGLLVVEGAKRDGVDGLFRATRDRLGELASVSKAHGRVFWARPAPGAFADWHRRAPEAGSFAAGRIDAGTAALAAALPARLPPRVADLGAGAGALSAAVLTREGPERVDLVEADHAALAAARTAISDPRAQFHWADATAWSAEPLPDAVVMNPPFHAGRVADPAVGRAFIAAAARLLGPRGELWLVANRHLPYEAELEARFARWQEVGGTAAFKLIHAAQPRARAKGHRR